MEKPKVRFLIIGGTGTLGQETTRQILARNPFAKITVLSRSEHKHQELKKKFPEVRYVLGDIRDLAHLKREFANVHTVFHFAALKHVDHAEENPVECIKTNLLGTINVAEACLEAGVKYCVFSSTDKAVDPITVYGNCKAISEKLMFDYNHAGSTKFSVFRWGNVFMSQGSAISTFASCIKRGEVVPVTDPAMTRFWISIEDAAKYLIEKYPTASDRDAMVHPNMKAAPVTDIIEAIAKNLGAKEVYMKTIGLRGTEKIHEALRSKHSANPVTSETCPQYTHQELRELVARAMGAA